MQVMGTNLTMIRGDSETISVRMNNNEGEEVFFKDGDIVYWTVKENLNATTNSLQVIVNEFDKGVATIKIKPSDTSELRAKEYIYDIQLTREDGTVTTIVKPSKFILEGDVTRD